MPSTDLARSLEDAAAIRDRSERTLRVAVVLETALRSAGDHPVLVGGAAVEIYTRSLYTTVDFDFVAAGGRRVAGVLRGLGFIREGRVWKHTALGMLVEIPSSTLFPAEADSMRVGDQALTIIRVEDLVVDRLAAWKHWGWHPDGVAAGLLLGIHQERMDGMRLRARAAQEEVADCLRALTALLDGGRTLTEERLARILESLR